MQRRSWSRPDRTRFITRIVEGTFNARGIPTALKYVLSLLVISALLAVRVLLPSPFDVLPLIIYLPGVMLCSFLFARGSGIFAAVLSLAYATGYSYLQGTLHLQYPAFLFAIPVFLLTALTVESLTEVTYSLNRQKKLAERADADKALRIQETVHRTRNDLATLASLVHLQASRLGDGATETRDALETIAHRLAVLVRVHERLHVSTESPDAPAVGTHGFLNDLLDDLRTGSIVPVGIEAEIEDHTLDHATAIGVGLIVNEAITNAIKYAFGGMDGRGRIRVTLREVDKRITVEVRDNGTNDGTTKGTGLGTRLMKSMAAQIDGTLAVLVDTGTTVVLRFPSTGQVRPS